MHVKKKPNPILMAAVKNQPAIISAILSHRFAPKINVDELDENGSSALGLIIQHVADASETSHAVLDLLKHGANPDSVESNLAERQQWNSATKRADYVQTHLTVLTLRQWNSSWQPIFEALGAAKIQSISDQWPILHEALARGNKEAVEFIIKSGAHVNRDDEKMGLPISSCMTQALFSLMVSSGAKLNLPDSSGRTGLQHISTATSSAELLSMATAAAQAESQGQVAVFKEGQSLSKMKPSDEIAQPLIQALFDSIDNNKKERVKVLWKTLNLGRDKARLIEARDKNGRTLLHAAIARRNFSLSKRLIARGLSVNVFDSSNQTPASLLLALSTERSERDRHGDRRRIFCAEVLKLIDWKAKTPAGLSYFDTLFNLRVDRANGVDTHALYAKAKEGASDWLLIDESESSCRLSRSLSSAVSERNLPIDSINSHFEADTPMGLLLISQMARQEFTPAHARMILIAAFSEPQTKSFDYLSSHVKKIVETLEAHLSKFIDMGVDPESIPWAANLSTGVPTFHAAIESWRLSNVARSISGPRARAKSL